MADYTTPQPAIDFNNWVERTQENYIGHDLCKNKRHYIPYIELQRYWEIPKITKILHSYAKPLPFDPKIIRSDYLRIFSALVLTGLAQQLLGLVLMNNLDDTHWPKRYKPKRWPQHDQIIHSAFKKLKAKHWIFFPFVFTPRQLQQAEYEDQRILPIGEPEKVPGYGSTPIYKINIHDGYNNLVGPADRNGLTLSRANNPVVFKSYCLKDNKRTFDNEVEAYNMLGLNAPSNSNLITFYGSFKQAGHGYLILESADGGNLSSYYDNKEPPTTAADINLFWSSLLNCLSGLDCVDQLGEIGDEVKQTIHGVHQDIKPANILLKKGLSGSEYEFNPMIADFGLFSHAIETPTSNGEVKLRNKYGTQRYSAPEVSAPLRAKMKGSGLSSITPGADIFSFGAVLSDAAAWVVGGKDLQKQYDDLRVSGHAEFRKIRGTDYQGCFHAGLDEFVAISEMHTRIEEMCRSKGEDQVTPAILSIVQKSMLCPEWKDRQRACVLKESFSKIVEPMSPATCHSPVQWPVIQNNVAATGNSTPIGLGSIPRINDFFSARRPDPMVQKLVDQITRGLRNRDQFFFVDDSTSMHAYRDVVLQGFEAIAHIAKRLDPNKVELAFASQPTHVHRARRTKKLVEEVRRHEFQHDPHLMEDSFSQLIEHQIIKKLPYRKMGFNINPIARKRMSIYVFTDGNWGVDPDGACRVEKPIGALIDKLKERKLSTHQVSLHFVRFGDSQQGGRHLDYLDRFGEHKDIQFDIVDVKSISSDFTALIYGPLSHHSDRSQEYFSSIYGN